MIDERKIVIPKQPIPIDIHSKARLDPDALAAEILGFVAADAERLARFLDLTGLTPKTLRRTAAQPGFSESLVDYLVADDRLVRAFAAERGYAPSAIEALRQRLALSRGEEH